MLNKMEDINDELSKLEELMAAECSDDEIASNNPCSTPAEPKRTLFLQEVVEKESNELLGNRSTKKQNSNDGILEKEKKVGIRNDDHHSIIHTGDTDSSDDEDKKNFLERKYTDYGSEVKKLLQLTSVSTEYVNHKTGSSQSFRVDRSLQSVSDLPRTKDVYTDPVFGLRIIKPLISSSVLLERMQGRQAVSVGRIQRHIACTEAGTDWVMAGVIVRKSIPKESQKGAQYSIWTLSDLKDELKTVALFLFRNAYKQLWKTTQGTAVGILNPSVLDKRDGSSDEACLSVDNHEKVMILGSSKDFGFCKSKKKNGDPCTSFVNTNRCGYCIYHVKQEYQRCSKRSDLQSSTAARGLSDLRNKVLGKSTYIYGGQSFSAIPAAKCKKQTAKDNRRLQTLSEYFKPAEKQPSPISRSPASAPVKKMASRVDVCRSQRLKDLERLEFLGAGSSKAPSPAATSPTTETVRQMSDTQTASRESPSSQIKLNCPALGIPLLGFGLKAKSTIDLSVPFSKKQSDRAKSNALKWIQQNGALNKCNPNGVRGTAEGKKRNLKKLNISNENSGESESCKRIKTGVASDHFKKMLETTSAHSDLITQHDDAEADKYFNKLEKKEQMEEKMLNTYKVACKAVRCLKCSYTSFSAADRCKQEKHPLRVFDATKRFFKCTPCSHRLVSLELIPTHACPRCGAASWQRAPMLAPRAATLAGALSICGGEDFLGHVDRGASVNLLVPEDGT